MSPASDPPPRIVFPCPDCGTRHTLRHALAGKSVRCPACGRTFRVPVPRDLTPPAPPPPREPRPGTDRPGRKRAEPPAAFNPYDDLFEEPPEGEAEP
jgi:predicted Zn finger-like uncharacterized protein